ncbi:MAG TPA: tol-pal system protein YbgF [Burkholderiales bacterium]
MRAAALLAAAALAWAGAASAQLFTDSEMRRRVDDLQKELQASQQRLDARLGALESATVERRVILDLAGQIEALRADVARMRGQTEVIVHQLETMEKRQKDLHVDLDTRLRRLEQAREQAATAPEKPAIDAGPTAAESKVYEAALNQFKLGNYSAAISTLQGLLVTYPDSKLAPNAQYWIGMGYSGQRDYKNAIAAHQKVIATWPTDPKAADAMLSIASSQEAMGDKAAAQKTLQNVMAKYPGTPAAANAKLRLAQASKR